MKHRLILLALGSLLLLAAGVGSAPDISFYATSGGGGHADPTGIYDLDTTIGQPAVGVSLQPSLELCAGFQCANWLTEKRVYLPVVQK